MIESYRNRAIDPLAHVMVYRNLSRPDGPWYSLVQRGRVVGHTRELALEGVTFVIRKSGRERARRERLKNVHAFVRGRLVEEAPSSGGTALKYSPFDELPGFVTRETPRLVEFAGICKLDKTGCHAWALRFAS